MPTSDESQQRNGRTAGSLGDAQLLFDKATAKVVIAEDSLMKCSEAFDIHLVRFTCFLFFFMYTSYCRLLYKHVWLHVSSWFFNVLHVCVKLVNVELPAQNIPKHPKTTYRCAGWDALLERHRGLAQGGRASARAACHACRCMSMHVDACLWSMLYLNVFGRLSWVILVDLWIFRSLSGRSWRSLCQRCEPVTWPSRRRWQQKVRPWRFSGAKSPRQALAVAHLEYLDIFRIIIELFRIFRYIWHIIRKQLIILAWWIWMNMTYRYI